MDAVNAALGVSGEPTTELENTNGMVTDSEESSDALASGDDSHADGADGDAAEDASGGEPGVAADSPDGSDASGTAGLERNADGTFKPKQVDPAADAAGKDAAAAAAAAAAAGAKKPDPVNDPIPKDLKVETQERIRTLIKTTKDVTAERDTIKQDFDYLVQGVQSTGASPEQYGEVLSWLGMFNSGDVKQQEQALALAENVADRLATMLGKERAVGDPLSAHADLKDAIAKGQITPAYAKEVARTRNASTVRTEMSTAAQTQQQQEQQQARELAQARKDLTDLEGTLRSTDPQYQAKREILVAALKPVFATLPPVQWKQQFEQAYRNLKINAPQARKNVVPANQPLRAGKNPAGGQVKAPSSGLEAVNAALASMK
jgi:hypothetical protein